MIFHKLTFVLLGLVGALLCDGFFFQNADQLFQTAVYQEEVEGNLKGAIESYQMILNRFPGNRSVAAKALLRIGLCHLKLGNKEAQSAFQKVINDYSDQADTVKQAREQLAVLLRGQTPIETGGKEYKITKIYTDTRSYGLLSPDGTRVALIDGENALWVRDIASGKEVRLNPTPELITDCWWSPDSKLIAYFTGVSSVRIVTAAGGQPKTIIEIDAEMKKAGQYAWPMGWTADSSKLIFQVSTKQSHEGLYAIPATGGKWEEVYKFPDPKKARELSTESNLSPDGKFIAYTSKQGGNSDIYVMPVRGGAPVRITDDPANDSGPKWSYDGQWLAFRSSRSGESGTWVIRITPDGKPDGRPVQATRGDHGTTWTQDGKIAYSTETNLVHVYTANMDGSQETKLTKVNDQNRIPRWSPDGKSIAFVANYGAQANRYAVWTVPSNGGDEKFLAVGWLPAWSPDGRKIAFCNELPRLGEVSPHKAILFIIPAEGGEARELMNYDGTVTFPDWSPDGGQIVFSYSRVKDGKNPIPDSRESEYDIYMISVNGGEPKRLTRSDNKDHAFMAPRWSPDGKKIAFIWMNRAGVYETGKLSEPQCIYTMNSDGGEHRLVTKETPGNWFCWSRDGKNIIFSKSGGFYRVPAAGGKAEPLNIKGGAPDLSPDGKKIAFFRGENRLDLWLVENFLPVDKKEK